MARRSESETAALEAGDHAARNGSCGCQGALRTRGGIAGRHQAVEDAKADLAKSASSALGKYIFRLSGRIFGYVANMRITFCSLALGIFFVVSARADLTIAYSTTVQPASKQQTTEAPETTQAATNMTIKVTYWVAPNYPNGAAILAQLQSVKSEFWDAANTKMPDFRDFPGLPIRMRIILTKEDQQTTPSVTPAKKRPGHSEQLFGHATEITSTITSVNENPISDSEFTVPADYKEPKLPDIFGKPSAAPPVSPSP